METATKVLILIASIGMLTASILLLMTVRAINDAPVGGTEDTCNTMTYRWEMGRLIKDC